MPLPKAGKIAIGLLSAGGVSGGVVYGYSTMKSTTIESHLKGTLVKKEELQVWKNKVVKLSKANKSKLSDELKQIKSNSSDIKIRDWCYGKINNKFSSEEDSLFKEVKLLCTYDIKEKIKPIADTAWSDVKYNNKLKQVAAGVKLSKTMQDIKAKLIATSNADTNALKTWCNTTYEKPFKSEKDQEYLDAKDYCQVIQ